MDRANLLPYLQPQEGEDLERFLQRAADLHEWPAEERTHDLAVLRDLLLALDDRREAVELAGYILRALSFSADPRMALRHFVRYFDARGVDDQAELRELRHNSEHLHFLCSLFSFSKYLSEIVIGRPDFLSWVFRQGRLNSEKSIDIYRSQLAEWLAGVEGGEKRLESLTLFKKRELLRVGIRDLLEAAGTQSLCRELSNMAQAIIEVVTGDCLAEAEARHGRPLCEGTDQPSGFAVYAMGKFGAGELNFSSDVDLIFLYEEEGETEGAPEGIDNAPPRRISNHEFFNKVAQEITTRLSGHGAEGFLFRVDVRLRPEGKAGSLARSRPGYAQYFSGHAGIWEKIAYLKARFVAGSEELAKQFDPIVEQFVFFNNEARILFPEIARLKRRIDFDALSAEGRELDIKRGRGGIREIEFIVAGLQLVRGGEVPGLRVRPTLEAAHLLVGEGLLAREDAARLEEAYHLFRRVEHTLQMMNETQTHTLPEDRGEREALALRCGFLKAEEFEQRLTALRDFVRAKFDEVIGMPEGEGRLTLVDYLFGEKEPPEEFLRELAPAGLGDHQGFRLLRSLAVGTSEYSPSRRGQLGFQELLPKLLEELPRCAMPDQAVRQFDLLLRASRGFTWVYELCLSNPAVLKLFLRTLGFGSLLARQLIAHPEWLDEIFANHGLSDGRLEKSLAEYDLAFPGEEPEQGLRRLRRFRALEGFLISLQEVLAVAPSCEAAGRMTRLAEAVLAGAMSISMREVLERAGAPEFPGRWAVIGLGGLGDRQVHLTGDLDIAIVIDSDEEWRGEPLGRWMDRIAQGLIGHMSALTPEGQLWKIDARLRPEGKTGPLASVRGRFVQYYREEAGLWEWQVLTKARPVAGDLEFGREVLGEVLGVLVEQPPGEDVAVEVLSMRDRIAENARVPRNALFDLKRSPGGLIDIEFLVQYLQLLHPEEARELFSLTTEEALEEFRERGAIAEEDAEFLRRHLTHLRAVQRFHRLLFETTHDYFPASEEKQQALQRGLAEQAILTDMACIDTLAEGMRRAREIFRRMLAG